MKNKNIKNYAAFLLSLLAFTSLSYCSTPEASVEEQLIDTLDKLLMPDFNQGSKISNVFSYKESNNYLTPKRIIKYNQVATQYGSQDDIYEHLYDKVSQLVPNSQKSQYITSDMWKAAIKLYCGKSSYFLTNPLHPQEKSKNQIEMLEINWGKENGGKGAIPTKLALLLVFKNALEKNISKKQKSISFFSKEGFFSSRFIRFLWPNINDLSKQISSLKMIQSEINNNLNFYIENLSPIKIEALKNKARESTIVVNEKWSQEDLNNKIDEYIKKVESEAPSKSVSKKKARSSFFTSRVFKILLMVAIVAVGFIGYIATLGPKNKSTSQNSDTDESEQFDDDDDEFDEE